MSERTAGPAPLPLPEGPNLDWLRKQAKRRLEELRATAPATRLAAAQFEIAKRYGFSSWRALKAHIDSLSLDGQLVAAADAGDVEALSSLLDRYPEKLQAGSRSDGDGRLGLPGRGVCDLAHGRRKGPGGDPGTGRFGRPLHRLGAAGVGRRRAAHRGRPGVTPARKCVHRALSPMSKRGDLEAVRWLLAQGADPNGRWWHWDAEVTPLHMASAYGHAEVVRLLLDASADPSLRDSKHEGDARGWASHFRRPEIVRILDRHAAG